MVDEIKVVFKNTDLGLIPNDWEVKSLGEIGDFKNGINKSSEDFGFGFPLINLMDVFGKTHIKNTVNYGLINSNEAERKLYNLIEGDVLFIRSSVKPDGVGLTALIKQDLSDTVFSGFIIRFRDNGFLNTAFKEYCFYNESFRKLLIANSTISANTNINQVALKKLKIVFPPDHKEQQSIANVLSDFDNLISTLKALISKKRNIKQGVMQTLLNAKTRVKQYSDKWETKKLGDIVQFSNGKAHENVIDNYGKYTVVNSKFISTEGRVAKCTNEAYCLAKSNDVLMVMSDVPNGKAIAKCYLVKQDEKYTVNQRICILRPTGIDAEFLFLILNRHPYYLSFDDGSKQTNLKREDVLNCKLTIPKSIEEQKDITKIIIDLESEILSLVSKLNKYEMIKQGMMQNLLTGKIRLL